MVLVVLEVLISVIIEDVFFLGFLLLVLELVDDLLLLLASLGVLQVVHVKLVLKVVNVGEFFDISRVIAFKLGF